MFLYAGSTGLGSLCEGRAKRSHCVVLIIGLVLIILGLSIALAMTKIQNQYAPLSSSHTEAITAEQVSAKYPRFHTHVQLEHHVLDRVLVQLVHVCRIFRIRTQFMHVLNKLTTLTVHTYCSQQDDAKLAVGSKI